MAQTGTEWERISVCKSNKDCKNVKTVNGCKDCGCKTGDFFFHDHGNPYYNSWNQ